MTERYEDMWDLPRPLYQDLPPMARSDRAAQFAPFAALTGFEALMSETARTTDRRRELTEEETLQLNDRLRRLLELMPEEPRVRLTCFIPDPFKPGGSYADKTGTLRLLDSYTRELVFTDGTRVPIDDLICLETEG